MHSLDYGVTSFFVSHSFHAYFVYRVIEFIADNDLFKGCFFSLLIWYLWFFNTKNESAKKDHLLITLVSTLFVLAIALGLGNLLPLRPRPFLNTAFKFAFYDANDPYIGNISSFPSDHAALFASLATGFLFVSRKVGILAFFYVIIFVMVPRLYLGYHYFTDLLGGAAIGAIVTYLANRWKFLIEWTGENITPFTNNYPYLFYPMLFLFTHQIANLFTEAREALNFICKFHKFFA